MSQRPDESSSDEPETERLEQIEAIRKRLADLKARWPRHSVPPAMLQELEELEDQLWEIELG